MKLALKFLQFVTLAVTALSSPAHAATEIMWWHAMSGQLGKQLEKLAADFNASQSDYRIVPTYKGSYTETVTAAIFAFRSRSQPAIVQVNEIATATMMAAKGAIYPVFELMRDQSEPFSPEAYLPAVTGYYSDVAGNMLSFPFNVSTPILYYNKDAFRAAGLDPEVAPKTWPEVGAAAKRLRAAGFALRTHHILALLDQCREFFRIPQFADGDPGQRLRRSRCGARLQQSAGGPPHCAACGMAERRKFSTTAAGDNRPSRVSRKASAESSSARRRRARTSRPIRSSRSVTA